jgi:hypothetical protein
MCKYCDGSLDEYNPLFRTEGAIFSEAVIVDDKLEIGEYYAGHGFTVVLNDSYKLKISYCPMCGAKL